MNESTFPEIDERTKKYFDELITKVAYQGYNGGWYGIEEIIKNKGLLEEADLRLIQSHPGYANSSPIDVYEYSLDGKARFCAELSYQTDVDDYCIETHIFDKSRYCGC